MPPFVFFKFEIVREKSMTFAAFVEETAEVDIGSPKKPNKVTFYPLTLNDLGMVLDKHRETAGKFLDESKGQTSITIHSVMRALPEVIDDLLVLSSREKGAEKIVPKLPVGKKLKCAVAVYKLAEVNKEDLGNLINESTDLLHQFNRKMESSNSTGGSATLPQQ